MANTIDVTGIKAELGTWRHYVIWHMLGNDNDVMQNLIATVKYAHYYVIKLMLLIPVVAYIIARVDYVVSDQVLRWEGYNNYG